MGGAGGADRTGRDHVRVSRGKAARPQGAEWEEALDRWRELPSDADATFDEHVRIEVAELAPR